MEFFSGLDVSIDETAICVVDEKGAVHLHPLSKMRFSAIGGKPRESAPEALN
jgi:hypothetical protein